MDVIVSVNPASVCREKREGYLWVMADALILQESAIG